jgi:hypothetical protein
MAALALACAAATSELTDIRADEIELEALDDAIATNKLAEDTALDDPA